MEKENETESGVRLGHRLIFRPDREGIPAEFCKALPTLTESRVSALVPLGPRVVISPRFGILLRAPRGLHCPILGCIRATLRRPFRGTTLGVQPRNP